MMAWCFTVIASLLEAKLYNKVSVNGHAVRIPLGESWSTEAPPNPPPPPAPTTAERATMAPPKPKEPAECKHWAAKGECVNNPGYMTKNCMLSCADVLRDVYDSGMCKSWASAGECEVNAAFMFSSCAGACHAAGARKKAYSERCPRTNSTDTLAPGDLLSLFARAVSDFPELSPSLLSPSPPIAVFDNFLSAPEIEALLKVAAVTKRVADVTGVDSSHSEFAQLLEYQACKAEGDADCQFYKRHHDYIDTDREMNQGVRILTLFIYLSNVTRGGHTAFYTDPPLSVKPQAGRAVLWASVLDEDPHTKDPRTEHEARPVLEGTKLAANFWIHQRDFRGAHKRGCTHA